MSDLMVRVTGLGATLVFRRLRDGRRVAMATTVLMGRDVFVLVADGTIYTNAITRTEVIDARKPEALRWLRAAAALGIFGKGTLAAIDALRAERNAREHRCYAASEFVDTAERAGIGLTPSQRDTVKTLHEAWTSHRLVDLAALGLDADG